MCRIMPDVQVPFWIGTHGEMISSDLHGAEDPIRWMLRPHQGERQDRDGSGALHRRRRGRSTRGTLAYLNLGVLALFQWNIGLRRPRTSPMMTMMSSNLMDVLGGRPGNIGTCGRLEKPKEGQHFALGCSIFPRRG
jgi:hypothetical protein